MSAGLLLALALRLVGGVWNPEDMLALPGTHWAVASAMRSADRPGGLRLVDLAHPSRRAVALPTAGPDPARFAPHGLGLRRLAADRFELLVVDHGDGEAIDRFEIAGRAAPRVVAFTRITMPAGTSGNGVTPLGRDDLLATSMLDPGDPTTLARFAAGRPTGRLWRWSRAVGWRAIGPAMSGANGVAASHDGRFAYVTEWAGRRIWRIALDGSGATAMRLSFLPDNLHWDGRRLLVAGQLGRPEQVYGCASRHIRCPMGYRVAGVDPTRLRIVVLRSVSDAQARRKGFGGATGAVAIQGSLWITSFTGTKLLRLVPKRPAPTGPASARSRAAARFPA